MDYRYPASGSRMRLLVRQPFTVFARGASLRREVAYSLAIVRLILVPVIFLAIYYLFSMGRIVDRIVSVDAPVATLAEHGSIEMQDARRAERNYFLLQDPGDLEAIRNSLSQLEQIVGTCHDLQPAEHNTTQAMLDAVKFYRQRLDEAAGRLSGRSQVPAERIRTMVRAYEKELKGVLRRDRHDTREHLINDLRASIGSLDFQIAASAETTADPNLRQISADLRTSSDKFLSLSSELEKRSWERVNRDHQDARLLIRRAEWVLGIVSFCTLLLSIAVSFILPRRVVKPLADLKAAVDHATAGNYEIEFDLQGKSEVVQLANGVRDLIAHLREKETSSAAHAPAVRGRR